jgi:hypothetical protein
MTTKPAKPASAKKEKPSATGQQHTSAMRNNQLSAAEARQREKHAVKGKSK